MAALIRASARNQVGRPAKAAQEEFGGHAPPSPVGNSGEMSQRIEENSIEPERSRRWRLQ
jgi:hypothetical protein